MASRTADKTIPVALTVAGSDPSGGAGLQADLKTFHQHGVFGCSAVTMITVQNTRGVDRVVNLSADLVAEQIDAVLVDLAPKAIKTGALGSIETIEMVASQLREVDVPVVVDPVMVSKHGHCLMELDAVQTFVNHLLPIAALVTPNWFEIRQLTGIEVRDVKTMVEAAARLAEAGAPRVLVKGGNHAAHATDVLWSDGRAHEFSAVRYDTRQTHGSGCTLSAAITARLASGDDFLTAVDRSKQFVSQAIRTAPGLGNGNGPLNLNIPTP